MSPRADIMQGTLDLMVLRTLDTLGPMHGWGIAQRLEQVSDDVLRVNQGSRTRRSCGWSSGGSSARRWGSPRTTAGRGSTASLPRDAGSSLKRRRSGRSSPASSTACSRVGGITMRSLISWVSRLFGSIGGGRRDAEIHDELAFHLEMQEKLERDRGRVA